MPRTDDIMKPKCVTTKLPSLARASNSTSTSSQSSNLNSMHRPPTIIPNYGKIYKDGYKLKTNLPKVLLYDNVTQQSILDVQISQIQSQRYKIARQFENSLKAFLLQQQRKDEALSKLTKVYHEDSYIQFELDHSMFASENDGKITNSNYANRLILAGIQKDVRQKMNGINLQRNPGKRKQCTSDIFKNEIKNRPNQERTSFQSGAPETSSDIVHLPSISNSLSSSQATNNRTQMNSFLHIALQRHQHVESQKNSSNSRETLQYDNDFIIRDEVHNSLAKLNNQMKTNETYTSNISIDNSMSNYKVFPGKNVRRHQPISTLSSHPFKYYTGNVEDMNNKQAVLDYRFQHLQKVLVRQVPPNEGFSELSPSFAKAHIFQNFSGNTLHFYTE